MELSRASVRLPAELSPASVAVLQDDFARAFGGPASVVALTGACDETFCTGLAIGEALDGAPATHTFAAVLAQLQAAPKPTIAVVNGQAIGGGLGIACACDWIIATDRATFALPELLWGIVPAIIWPLVADRLSLPVARRWTLSGHTRTAAEAHAAGLLDDLVRPDDLDRAVRRVSRVLSRLDPEALVHLRQWVRTSRHDDLPAAMNRGADLTAALVSRPEVRRRWQAFAAGESPWSA